MRNALEAGTIYFFLVFTAGFAFGTMRTLVIAPAIGDLIAVAFELPLMLAIAWIACGWVLRRISVPNLTDHRIAMGAFAFILLMAAEVLMSTAALRSKAFSYLGALLTSGCLRSFSTAGGLSTARKAFGAHLHYASRRHFQR
jgi:ABC-type uncharacterized transport system permease subunit